MEGRQPSGGGGGGGGREGGKEGGRKRDVHSPFWYSLGREGKVEVRRGAGGELVCPLALNYLELMEGGAEGGRGGG